MRCAPLGRLLRVLLLPRTLLPASSAVRHLQQRAAADRAMGTAWSAEEAEDAVAHSPEIARGMQLELQVQQTVNCGDVVAIAEAAGAAIMAVYATEVCAQEGVGGVGRHVEGGGGARRRRPPDAFSFTRPLERSQTEDWGVQAKADNSPLTRADKEANAVICAGLARIGAPRQVPPALRRLGARARADSHPPARPPLPALPLTSPPHPHRLRGEQAGGV